MKLSVKRSGKGYASSYTIVVTRTEALALGWTDEAGEMIVPDLVKSIDSETQTLTVRPAE